MKTRRIIPGAATLAEYSVLALTLIAPLPLSQDLALIAELRSQAFAG